MVRLNTKAFQCAGPGGLAYVALSRDILCSPRLRLCYNCSTQRRCRSSEKDIGGPQQYRLRFGRDPNVMAKKIDPVNKVEDSNRDSLSGLSSLENARDHFRAGD